MTSKVDPTEFAGKRVLVSGGTKGWVAPRLNASWPAAPG